MLNTRYIIYPGEENRESVQLNEDANGNAWFVEEVKWVNSANEEIRALDSLDTKRAAVVNAEYNDLLAGFQPRKELDSQIELISYAPNEIRYHSNSQSEQLAVFSEMFYEHGWNAYIDGELMPHFRVNYVLRALRIKGGEHDIVFKFEPGVIQVGNRVTLVSYFLLLLVPGAWYLIDRKRDVQSYPEKTV